MNSLRPKRAIKRTIHFDEREGYIQPIPQKKAKKAVKKGLQTLTIEPANAEIPTQIQNAITTQQPEYSPPIRIENKPFKVRWLERDPFTLFLRLLGGLETITLIV